MFIKRQSLLAVSYFIYGGNMGNKKISPQSFGGKVTALKEKEEARKRIDEYNQNPNKCLYCGKDILASYDQKLYNIKNKKFCNQSCSAKYNNQNRNYIGSGTKNVPSLIDNFTDEQLIDIYNSSNSIVDFKTKLGYRRSSTFSNKIKNRLANIGIDLNDKVLTKYNNSDYILNMTKETLFNSRSWQGARGMIQKKARLIYNNSNKPKECAICGYSKHFEVAHIKAVSLFDSDSLISEINDISNLIALCPNHHWEYDNDNLDISLYL